MAGILTDRFGSLKHFSLDNLKKEKAALLKRIRGLRLASAKRSKAGETARMRLQGACQRLERVTSLESKARASAAAMR